MSCTHWLNTILLALNKPLFLLELVRDLFVLYVRVCVCALANILWKNVFYLRHRSVFSSLFVCFFFVLWLVTIAQFVEAKAILPGPSDLYVKTGSEVVLTCIVSQGPHELGTILWYQGNNPFLVSFFLLHWRF